MSDSAACKSIIDTLRSLGVHHREISSRVFDRVVFTNYYQRQVGENFFPSETHSRREEAANEFCVGAYVHATLGPVMRRNRSDDKIEGTSISRARFILYFSENVLTRSRTSAIANLESCSPSILVSLASASVSRDIIVTRGRRDQYILYISLSIVSRTKVSLLEI